MIGTREHFIMRPLRRCPGYLLLGILLLGAPTRGHTKALLTLQEKDVVTFLGGTNMVHLQQSGQLEVMLTQSFSGARPRFRDLSWESDTVFRQGSVIERWRKDGFGNHDDQLKRIGTTVLCIQFGQLESLSGPTGLEPFRKSYQQLIDRVSKQTRQIVLITPTPFEKPPSPLIPDLSKRNDDLAAYVEVITELARQRELLMVDLFHKSLVKLTDNGMHVTPPAQARVAREITRQLGITVPPPAHLEPLRKAVIEKHRLWYDYWRPANWKLLYGDDSRRQFTRGSDNSVPFKEEWKQLLLRIQQAEERIWRVAGGGQDPGHDRPDPETLHGVDDADIRKELASFKVPEGFQVNLFASEREGLTSPLSLRWDPAGRMYVTVTTTYPHVFPGDVPNDKIIILEDRDRDGRADQSRVFAAGLNIPTGLEWGDGGVYVGQNTEILFLKDTDHDGRADQRRVLLGGFGNGDSHQTINSFIWSPAGELYLGQGDGCESRVETPWGASNLFQAGFYRFRPRRLQLHPLLDDFMGPGNPWGVAFDDWGQIFSVDGAGGVTYLSPGQIPSTHRLRLKTIGRPGGYCGIGYLDGRHLPPSMHGDFVVGDFKSNRIKRFSVKEDGAGFSLQWKDPLLESRHRNFRPVDVKVGPDGAVYVVDWYNPITCHQDDAYRHPNRDKAHGRIWRISSRQPTTRPADLSQAPLDQVLEALKSPEHWTRYQAKRACTTLDTATVSKALDGWVQNLDPKLPRYEHHLYEALGTYATLEVIRPGLLGRLLQAQDPRARAYATRIVGRWHDRLEEPLALLTQRITDEHPRVRMEAVLACAAIDSPRSIEVAARVVDQPIDSWIEYAFKQAVHHLQPYWMPAFKQGTVSFTRPNHLAAVLNETGGRDVLESLKKLLETPDLKPPTRTAAIATILAVGGPGELKSYGLDAKAFTQAGRYDVDAHARALGILVAGAGFRDVRPEGDLGVALSSLIQQSHPELQVQALSLAGSWKVDQVAKAVSQAARNITLPIPVRAAAFTAMVDLRIPGSRELLLNSAMQSQSHALKSAAVKSLAALDLTIAAQQAAALFATGNLKPAGSQSILTAFLDRTGGAEALAAALQIHKLKPAVARQLLAALFSTGRSDQALMVILNRAMGTAHQTPDYNKAYVQQLVEEARKTGNAKRGRILFKTVACASCHKVGGNGGRVGPDLTAIGTTLSAERIVEELLWPNRQVKEGYSLVRVITDAGRIHQGYQRRTKESDQSGDLVLEDLATKNTITIKQEQIDEKHVTGSVMPQGLPALLSRPQLLDLIGYLSGLGQIK